METLGERLAYAIKALGMTRQKFAESIGVSSPSVTLICTGKNNAANTTIFAICKTHHISEEWLRYGTGEMFVQSSVYDEIAEYAARLSERPLNDFELQLIRILSRLPEDDWRVIEKVMREAVEAVKEAEEDKKSPDQ